MASIGEPNSTDSNLSESSESESESSESETDKMTLKDLKMAALARAAAKEDRKEGTTAPANEKRDPQEGGADQDDEKEKTNQNIDEELSDQESDKGGNNDARSESDADSDSENETLATLVARKDQTGEYSRWDDSSDDDTWSVYYDGSEASTFAEEIFLTSWSDDSLGIKDTFTSDEEDNGVSPICDKSFKKVLFANEENEQARPHQTSKKRRLCHGLSCPTCHLPHPKGLCEGLSVGSY